MRLSKAMRRTGKLCFALMWIPFATLMIGMLQLPEGSYSWSELPALARYSLLAGGFFVIAAVGLFLGGLILGAATNRALLNNGRSATATILQLADTGTTINNDPVVRLLLEVHAIDQPHFQAEAERLISRLQIPQLQPGSVVQVKYDPTSRAVALVNA